MYRSEFNSYKKDSVLYLSVFLFVSQVEVRVNAPLIKLLVNSLSINLLSF